MLWLYKYACGMYMTAYKCVHVCYVHNLCYICMFGLYISVCCVSVNVCCMCALNIYMLCLGVCVYIYVNVVCVRRDIYAFFPVHAQEVKEKIWHYLWRIQPQIK